MCFFILIVTMTTYTHRHIHIDIHWIQRENEKKMFTFRAMYSSKANQKKENNDDERKGEPQQRNTKKTS